MSGVTFQPANWFLWEGLCSLECFFSLCAERNKNNITQAQTPAHEHTHTQVFLLFCYHTTYCCQWKPTAGCRIQAIMSRCSSCSCRQQQSRENVSLFFLNQRHWGCFCPFSQTSNVIHDDSWRLCVTFMARYSAVHRNIQVHAWNFQNSPYEILQRRRAPMNRIAMVTRQDQHRCTLRRSHDCGSALAFSYFISCV